MSRVFLIKTAEKNQYYFVLKDDNNEIILRAKETYKSVGECKREIEAVKTHVANECRFIKYNDRAARPTFRLRDDANKIIGVGEPYHSIEARDNGIEKVRRCSVNAPVINDLLI